MYCKFDYVNSDMLSFLFKSYCSSFYGAELWFDKSNAKKEFNRCAIAYHKSIKRIAKQSTWSSNHDSCERLELPIFKHMINAKILNFYMNILNSNSPCLSNLKQYYRSKSFIKTELCRIFVTEYGVADIFDNDLMALNARIGFVQRNEPRSDYVPRVQS